MRHIIPVSGKDSCATAIVQLTRQPDLPYELFFSDVGAELPETYAWLNEVEKKLGKKVHRVGKSLEQIIYDQGILPAPNTRFCTRLAKIQPMEDFIGSDEATLYFGMRADEDRVGYVPTQSNIHPCYPLKELGIDLPAVYSILDRFDLKPPTFFWSAVHEQVKGKLDKSARQGFGLVPGGDDILKALPPWLFTQLFAWRSRSNCYFCFFQRQHEWAGLLEYHPDLFARAEEIETTVGNNEQHKPFTWTPGLPLAEIRRNKDRILKKRAVKILKILRSRRANSDPVDLLSLTSCGFFCGK